MIDLLDISEGNDKSYHVQSLFDGNVLKNKIWYRGDPHELCQLYNQVQSDNASFWSDVCQTKEPVRRIHTGLPALIIDRLTDITVSSMGDIVVNHRQDIVDAIVHENNMKQLMKSMVSDVLYIGDGAMKISIDTAISQYPILEWYPGDRVLYVYKRGRLQEVIFKNSYNYKNKHYLHLEHFGFGYIKNALISVDKNINVPLATIPELAKVRNYQFAGYTEDKYGNPITKGNYIMAIPVKFKQSSIYEGRGESVFDKRISSFDALDEIASRWINSLRVHNLTGDNLDVTQAFITPSSYSQSYMFFLDACLAGLISPESLGLYQSNNFKWDKEKTTMETRKKIITILSDVVYSIIKTSMHVYCDLNHQIMNNDIKININFEKYDTY